MAEVDECTHTTMLYKFIYQNDARARARSALCSRKYLPSISGAGDENKLRVTCSPRWIFPLIILSCRVIDVVARRGHILFIWGLRV